MAEFWLIFVLYFTAYCYTDEEDENGVDFDEVEKKRRVRKISIARPGTKLGKASTGTERGRDKS